MTPLLETAGPAAALPHEGAPCRSCQMPILWRKHERSDKSMPIDATPSRGGTVWLNRDNRTYRIERSGLALSFSGRLHTSHYETCPDRTAWRKGQAK